LNKRYKSKSIRFWQIFKEDRKIVDNKLCGLSYAMDLQ